MSENNGTMKHARRPQLAETITRLDEMIDGLAEAIPGAVADSVRETLAAVLPEVIRVAIEQATAELAARMSTLVPAPIAAPAPMPLPAQESHASARVKAAIARLKAWATNRCAALQTGGAQMRTRIGAGLATVRVQLGMLATVARSSPRAALCAVGAGVAAGISAYALGTTAAAVVAGSAVAVVVLCAIWAAPFAALMALNPSARSY